MSSFNERYLTLDWDERIAAAIDAAETGGGTDGAHHKQWALDQVIRALTGPGYEAWRSGYEDGEDGPETYWWDEGIAP